jgi:hypothetical protein
MKKLIYSIKSSAHNGYILIRFLASFLNLIFANVLDFKNTS